MRHHHIETNGITLHVAELGSGPKVLLCHGFPAIWSSWRAQMHALAQAGYRVLAPDMRGYGDSDAPPEAEVYTPFHTVGDMVGVLDRLDIAAATIVGHDFGASVAWNAALLRPDRFPAVFGVSVPFLPPVAPGFLDDLRAAGRDDFYMFAQMRPEADQEWANAASPATGAIYWTSGLAQDTERWDPFDPARGLLRPAPAHLAGVDAAYLQDVTRSFARTGFHGPLNYYRAIDPFFGTVSKAFSGAQISQPSYFLTGALDGLNAVRPVSDEALRAHLPGLRGWSMLDGVGHWPQLEAPTRLNTVLLDFVHDVTSA